MCRRQGRRCPSCKNPSPEKRARENARRREVRRYRKDLIKAARARGGAEGDALAREIKALPAVAFAAATQALGLTPDQVSTASLAQGRATHPVPDMTAFAEATASLRDEDAPTDLLYGTGTQEDGASAHGAGTPCPESTGDDAEHAGRPGHPGTGCLACLRYARLTSGSVRGMSSSRKPSARTSSPLRTRDPAKCGYPMGEVSKGTLRFCTRPRATCQYHRAKRRA